MCCDMANIRVLNEEVSVEGMVDSLVESSEEDEPRGSDL